MSRVRRACHFLSNGVRFVMIEPAMILVQSFGRGAFELLPWRVLSTSHLVPAPNSNLVRFLCFWNAYGDVIPHYASIIILFLCQIYH